MAALILPDSRFEQPELFEPGRKPVGNVRVDESSVIGQGLVWYNLFNTPQAKPLVNRGGALETYAGNATLAPSRSGQALNIESYSHNFYYTDDTFRTSIADKLTFFIDCDLTAWLGNSLFLFSNSIGLGYNWGIYLHGSSSSIIAYVKGSTQAMNTPVNVIPVTLGNRYRIVVVYDGAEFKIFCNGVLNGVAAFADGNVTQTNAEVAFDRWGTTDSEVQASFYSAGVMNIALSDSQALHLSMYPYQFLIPA